MEIPYLTLYSSLDTGAETKPRRFNVQHLQGEEELAGEFSYDIEVSTFDRLTEDEISQLLGDTVTVKIAFADADDAQGFRYVNGIVYRIREKGETKLNESPDFWQYKIEIGSWFRQLEQIKDCRVFQKGGNDTQSLVTDLLKEMELMNFEFQVQGTLPKREYVVIYNETVANFIRRLFLADGLFWYYEHSESSHKLVISDDSLSLPELSASTMGGSRDRFFSFDRESSYRAAKEHLVSSYNWEMPPVKNVLKTVPFPQSQFQTYDFANSFKTRPEGDEKIDKQMMAIQAHQTHYTGESSWRGFTIGSRFTLDAPRLSEVDQKKFLITKLRLVAGETYINAFTLTPAEKKYYKLPDESVRKPIIYGTQTAKVVGEGRNGEVTTDQWGRVKIHFYWDHLHEIDKLKTAAFVRVAIPAAGATRGCLFTPRIDEEVSVSFINGDPEQPIITGSVYSYQRRPPTEAAVKSYVSRIKTTNENDSNALTFDDTPDEQSLDMQAKKDLNIKVGGNLNIKVNNNIYVHAKKVTILIRKNIKFKAMGSIVQLAMDSLNTTAGSNMINVSLAGVVDVAGNAIANEAGALMTNAAILNVSSDANDNVETTADALLSNIAKRAFSCKGEDVEYEAKLALNNDSKGDTYNDAKEIKTQALFLKKKTKKTTTVETKKFNVKGLLSKIN